jgi:hypothetical protein
VDTEAASVQPNLRRIRLWYDALINGQYEQGTGQLATPPIAPGGQKWKHCCLGVAVDLACRGEDRIESIEVATNFVGWYEMGGLPKEAVQWYGLPDGDPMLVCTSEMLEEVTDEEEHASILNDDHLFTFTQIAEAVALTWPEILNEEYAR